MAESSLPQPPPQDEPSPSTTGQRSDIPVLYINTTRIGSSFFDIQLHLGETVQTSSSEELTRDHVVIVMSPEHAKALADLLMKTLDDYEGQFGKLRRLPT